MRDVISNLPDSLLLHILSFLPTKEAVSTSLLSKRWRPLWHSLSSFDLEHPSSGCRLFHRFIRKVLKLVDLKPVKKFVLRIQIHHYEPCKYITPSKICEWINAVISNKIDHLELYLQPWWSCELPSLGFFTANNIKVLKLRGLTVINLSHVNLPSLEVLHLVYTRFSLAVSLEMLISACPLLKDLVVRSILFGHYKPLNNIGGLNHLITAEIPQYLLPMKVLSNVTVLRLNNNNVPSFWDAVIKQCMWPFSDDMPMFYNLTHLACVLTVEWTKMVNCLQYFPKLEKLVISESSFDDEAGITSPPEPVLDVPPCVSLHLKEINFCCFNGSDNEREMLNFLIKNARVLRRVSVK
ncbi:F-box/LRR-repeat protein 13-like [Neltuma alba]|uniref:F-box/LRR-repeat protein 13-like n=1 Tax=Neltuma alba TaxID=207710 RepID=UPI0010A4533B|nr:F-box/LRR-repeat protein 13-like [Prosopis alba]